MRTAAPPSALCLERYLEGLDGVPIPTPEQRAGFAEFVSEAHSWYKHLPRFTPGEPFTLFLDRHAGCDLERSADGSAEMVPRIRQ